MKVIHLLKNKFLLNLTRLLISEVVIYYLENETCKKKSKKYKRWNNIPKEIKNYLSFSLNLFEDLKEEHFEKEIISKNIGRMNLEESKKFNEILEEYPFEKEMCKKMNFILNLIKDKEFSEKIFEDFSKDFDKRKTIAQNIEDTDILKLEKINDLILHNKSKKNSSIHC